jgi:DNA-directed RNA polymerase II subunit RPB1
MMMTVLPVPPYCMRPSARSDDGKLSYDDLTIKLNDIVVVNNDLKELIKKEESYVNTKYYDLQNAITTYIDNTLPGVKRAKHRSGRLIKSIRQRIGGKDGRFRSNLMGKRVDSSIRSVITPDPNLSIDQVGIPLHIAREVLYPEIVNSFNIDELSLMLKNGPFVWPGIVSVQMTGAATKKNAISKDIQERGLKYGDVVYRHICNNDVVIVNRQPSLHKASMMCHRAVINPGGSIRLSPNVVAPYNGDFDGDEMNLHVPQSISTVTEIFLLALSSMQIISNQTSSPIIGLSHDNTLGMHLMSTYTRLLPYDIVMSLVSRIRTRFSKFPKYEKLIKGKPFWTSKSIINMCLPPINYSTRNKDKGTGISIINGLIDEGFFTKKELGAEPNSIFHILVNDFGPRITSNVIDNFTFIANEWLRIHGFSINIVDFDYNDKNVEKQVEQIKLDTQKELEIIIGKKLYESKGMALNDFIGTNILGVIDAAKGKIEALISKDPTNKTKQAFQMVGSGSKGKMSHMMQFMGMLGIQILDNTWITGGYYKRTTPHVPRDSLDPYSHGYIHNCYRSGLNVDEYYFACTCGRDNVISRTIRTANTGYVQRKLIKVAEGLSVHYDGTIRNENGIILQHIYGNDGFDGIYHEYQSMKLFEYTEGQLSMKYLINKTDQLESYLIDDINDEIYEKLQLEYNNIRNYYVEMKRIICKYKPNRLMSPINFDRVMQNIKYKFPCINDNVWNTKTDLTPEYVINNTAKLNAKMLTCADKVIDVANAANAGAVVGDVINKSSLLFRTLFFMHMSVKNIIVKYRCTKTQYDELCILIYDTFLKSLVTPGENIGISLAHAMGEAITQMNLDAFHISDMTEAMFIKGVPRLTECTELTKNIKVSSMMISLKSDIFEAIYNKLKQAKLSESEFTKQFDEENIKYLSTFYNCIKNTILHEYINSYDITYEPQNAKIMQLLKTISPLIKKDFILNENFILHINLNPNIILQVGNEIKIKEIITNVIGINHLYMHKHKPDISNESAQGNSVNSLDIYILYPSNQSDMFSYIKEQYDMISQIKFSGINGITINKSSLLLDKIRKPKQIQNSSLDFPYEYEFRILGSNFREIAQLPFVNIAKTVSNDIWETYKIFGIECARSCLIQELYSVIKEAKPDISIRHIELLADLMTSRGILVSVNRYGSNKIESNVLSHATFEETFIRISIACIFGENDNMMGPSANIMFGQNVPTGTCAFDLGLSLDPAMLPEDVVKSTDAIAMEKCDDNNMRYLYLEHTI